MIVRANIKGCGSYLPERILTNDQLAERVNTSDEWIQQRTGIKHRYIAGENELTSDLATKAALAALEHANIDVSEVDLIVCATATPDETFPATATVVQKNLGITRGAAFDLQAVCSGFVYGLSVVDSLIQTGQAKTALLIGAETFSRILDWEDRSTCVLFGDGAGAIVLQAEEGSGDTSDSGILSSHIYADGRCHDALYVDGGPSSTGTAGFLRMEGKEVFRQAVTRMPEAIDAALKKSNLGPEAIDWLVPHQANIRIIEAMGKKLKLPKERVVVTVDKHANTSAASIPLALTEAVYDGRIKRGDMIMMAAMGGGFTWGSALIRW